jgi:multiple sugar transport system permease protein
MDMSRFVEKNLRWIFPLPAALFVAVLMIFPIVFTVYLSLNDWNMLSGGAVVFIGLKNYAEMLSNARFWNATLRTIYFTVLAVGLETAFGVGVALILEREFRGKGLAKLLLLLPMVATPVAIGLAWTLFYEPTIGLANFVLKALGIPASKWIASNTSVIPSLAVVDIWEWTPMIALMAMAGLASLPQEPFESAMVDGATAYQRFRHVTLPLLSPTIVVAVVLRGIEGLKTFDIIYVMTAGGPGQASETLNIYSYNLSFNYFRFGAASATLIALFLLVLGSTLGMLRLRKTYDF